MKHIKVVPCELLFETFVCPEVPRCRPNLYTDTCQDKMTVICRLISATRHVFFGVWAIQYKCICLDVTAKKVCTSLVPDLSVQLLLVVLQIDVLAYVELFRIVLGFSYPPSKPSTISQIASSEINKIRKGLRGWIATKWCKVVQRTIELGKGQGFW